VHCVNFPGAYSLEPVLQHRRGFETDALPVHSSLLPVLGRLLQFTPDDVRRLHVHKSKTWLPPWQP